MRLNLRLIRLLASAAGTLAITFFLALGFSQLFQQIPAYTIQELSAKILKGGSPIGFKLAYFGTALLVAGQFYSLRKTMTPIRQTLIGSRKSWLRAHCYLDIMGSALLLIHSGFPFSFRYANPVPFLRPSWGLIGLAGLQGFAAWLILLTLVSGFVGEKLRTSPSLSRFLRPWLKTHILLTCLLFVFGTIHLIIVLWFKYVTAG